MERELDKAGASPRFSVYVAENVGVLYSLPSEGYQNDYPSKYGNYGIWIQICPRCS